MTVKKEFYLNQIESNIKNTVWYSESNRRDADAAIDVCVHKSMDVIIPILESLERQIKSHEDSFEKTRDAISTLVGLYKSE